MFGKQKAFVIKTDNNRVEIERITKHANNNIYTSFGNYIVSPSHGLVNYKQKSLWYFVNEIENNAYNPSSLKNDFNVSHRMLQNFVAFYRNLVDTVRNAEINDIPDDKITAELKRTIYNFKEDRPIKSDNINVTPATQKSIMQNEVAKGLSARSSFPRGVAIMLFVCGILPGVLLGAWAAGDIYNQQDYNENYYPAEPTNSTTVITAQMVIGQRGIVPLPIIPEWGTIRYGG